MSAATLPLLAGADSAAILAWRAGQPISVARYLLDVAALAAHLPASGPMINLCTDRYTFAVALGAALQRGQASLLPPNARPDTVAQLHQHAALAYGLTDDAALQTPGVPLHRLPLHALPLHHLPLDPLALDPPALDPPALHPLPLHPLAFTGLHAQPGPAGAAPGWPVVAADALATSLLTSGSTGQPQPHAKSWRQWTVNVGAAAQRLAQQLGRPSLAGLTVVATVPPQHSYGLESSVLLALLGGAAFEAGRPFYPADIVAALASVPRPRALVSTPFHLKALLLSGLDLPPTDLVLSATAPLSPDLARQAEARFGGVLVEIYGCTEAGQVASRRTALGDLWHTFGSLRVQRQPACAATPGGAIAGAGSAGSADEPAVFTVQGGHLAEPTPLSDRLQLTDASHFRLLGRANDLVHVAGKRSSIGLLDHHLNGIPGVQDGAFWLPDEVLDSVVRPVAFVVSATLGPAQVIAALRQVLEPVFVPRQVVLVPALPREATGKLTAQALHTLAQALLPAQAGPRRPVGAGGDVGVGGDGDVGVGGDVDVGVGVGIGVDASMAGPSASTQPAASSAAQAALLRHAHIPADHPAFAGHFPGQPILPGVCLLALVVEAWRDALASQPGCLPALSADGQAVLTVAKFLAPVGPGADLCLALQADGRQLQFEVTAGTVRVASGRFAAVPAQTGPPADPA